jgi:hypothetical protein
MRELADGDPGALSQGRLVSELLAECPLRSIGDLAGPSGIGPFYSRNRKCRRSQRMAAMGQDRTRAPQQGYSITSSARAISVG